MIYYDQSFSNVDFQKLEILFDNIIGDDKDISNTKIEQILVSFYSFCQYDISGFYIVKRQLYILQLFAKILIGRNFDSSIIYNALTEFLTDARKFLIKINKEIYSNIKYKIKDLPDYYLVFLKNNEFIFQKDCLDIFFKTSFVDINILFYDDYQALLTDELTIIYYEYLKIKTNGNLRFIEQKDIIFRLSARTNIYESALMECKIKEFIITDPNAVKILNTYYKFENRVLVNELQQFCTRSSTSKDVLLTSDTKFINKIKLELPLIYQVISALHIDTNIESSNKNFKDLLYKTIYEALYIEIIGFQSDDICNQLSNKIAINLTNSLFTGYYINPVTLQKLNICTNSFINQLKIFISEVFYAYT